MSEVVDIKHARAPRKGKPHRREEDASSPEANRFDDRRPVIRVTTEIHEVTDRAIEVIADDADVFQRDGELVRVTKTAETEADAFTMAGTPTIRKIALPTLRERLTRAAQWEKWDGRSEDWVAAIPNDAVVQAVAARGEFRGIRPIIGVAESPMLRPDGSVLEQPGYDPSTGYLYLPNAEFPPVPANPTKSQAAKALDALREVFCDFPYRAEADRIVPIAAVLTLVSRPAIRGSVPGFLFDANTRGSGKTKNGDAIAVIATGRETSKMTYPSGDDQELEKVLGAYALRGAAIVAFDNVTGRFGGGPLDRVLTAGDFVDLRVLGKSEVPTLRWRAVIIATGNNMETFGDTNRRILVSRIESKLERPEDRETFKHPNLLQWVHENRPRLVVAALTILRAWVVAGRPIGDCRTWGSFEAWSGLVPPALVYAGAADPMNCRQIGDDDDPERRGLLAIIAHWPRLDPGGGITAKAAINALYPTRSEGQAPDGFDDLRDALEELIPNQSGKPPSPAKLAYQLRRFKQRVVGDRMLDVQPGHGGVKRWRVLSVGGGA